MICGLLLLMILPACYVKNVTNDPRYKTDFEPEKIYVLKKDALMVSYPFEKWLSLQYAPFTTWMLPAHFLYKFGQFWWYPSSREEYNNNPKKWSEHNCSGAIEAGTRMRYVRTVYHYYVSGFTTYPIMEILDGPFTNKKVSVLDISIEWHRGTNITPKNDDFDKTHAVFRQNRGWDYA